MFCWIVGVSIFVLVGLRDPSVGGDADQYQRLYIMSSFESFGHFLKRFIVSLPSESGYMEPGFELIFYKIPQALGIGYQGSLIAQGLFEAIAVSYAVHRYSEDCLLSSMAYLCIFFSAFVLGGLRQSSALVLVVFFGYPLIEKRQLTHFLVLLAISFTIHRSSILFAPLFFISRIELSQVRILLCQIASFCLYPIAGPLSNIIFNLVGYGAFSYGYVGSSTAIYASLFISLSIFLLLCHNKLAEMFSTNRCFHVCAWSFIVVLFVLPFAFVNSNAMRAGWYFMVALIFLLPMCVKVFSTKIRSLVRLTALLGCVAVLLLTSDLVLPEAGYSFFFL